MTNVLAAQVRLVSGTVVTVPAIDGYVRVRRADGGAQEPVATANGQRAQAGGYPSVALAAGGASTATLVVSALEPSPAPIRATIFGAASGGLPAVPVGAVFGGA